MPGLLGPTTPVPNYDNTSQVKLPPPNPNDTSIQNVVDPSKVVRPDRRTDQQDAGNATLAQRYESNFMTFVQRLRNSPELAPAFMMVMQGQGLQVTSNLRSGFAAELAQFMEFLQMDETKLPAFLKEQLQTGTKFSGPLFQILRTAYNNTRSGMLQNDILQFLRKYSDFASTGHLESKILRTVENMARALPSRWSNQMLENAAKLENGVSAGDRQGNLKVLREQVFPLVSKYVSLTHDHGRARGLLSMLALDVARYENGSPLGLLMAMRHLASSGVFPEKFTELPDSDLLKILKNTNFFKAMDADGSSKTMNAGGSPKAMNADGSPKAMNADGSPKAMNADGSFESMGADGILKEMNADDIFKAMKSGGNLKELNPDDILKAMNASGNDSKEAGRVNSFASRLAELANHALKGEGGVEQQDAFRNILSSILINESVYMPLNHIMLPLEWNDRLMFSEIWIDPDEDKDNPNRDYSGDGPPPLRLLIKMDVEGLGAFDLMLNAKGKDVALQLACPPSVADLAGKMSEKMTDILERNGFQPGLVSVTAMSRPVTVSEVFPKIFERKTGVNVKI